jgi:hypothetical protein
MQPGPTPPVKDQLFFTALPNGRKGPGGDLRLSVLLTPSLNDNTKLPAPFDNWPHNAAKLKWTVTFLAPAHTPVSPAISAPIRPTIDPLSSSEMNPKLWSEIFAAVDSVKRRKRTNHLHKTWRLSHNITLLHKRHQWSHLVHAYKQASAKQAIAKAADLQALEEDLGAPKLFLYPEFGSNLALKIEDRKCAESELLALVAGLPTTVTIYSAVVLPRVKYAVEQLETYSGNVKLSAVSLSAVYISCLRSAVKLGTPDSNVDAAITTIEGWFKGQPTPKLNCSFQPDYPSVHTVIHYIEMLLFHRRRSVKQQLDIPKPDFHQLLGLVHNHPAIMRKLGLVFDFVVTPPAGLSAPTGGVPLAYSVIVNLDTSDSNTKNIADMLSITPVYTQCMVQDNDFFATLKNPAQNLIQNGLLNLQMPSTTQPGTQRFTLVPENADGQALKKTDQVNNDARSAEYATSAPTSMRPDSPPPPTGSNVSTPRSAVNPITAAPAPRTVGLALFDQDRLSKLEEGVSKIPPSDQPEWDFFADDLILGYRVDILYKLKFFSLCQRDSIYNIYEPYGANSSTSGAKIDSWKPETPMEISADEGFLNFGATQSPLTDGDTTDNPATTQTQVHQAILTWTGWALSVPQPNIPPMNPQPQQDATTQNKSQHFALQPKYTLPKNVKLPPLRFNTPYALRCRVVDLAGNSAPPGLDPYNEKFPYMSLSPISQFSRQEPIRAPQFLLGEAIDRTKEPGTHIDRMVARDNDKSSARMLAPPRESLRLAELSGFLTSDKLPSTAFGDQQLLEDGSFPSVACAKDKGWIDGDINKADNDGIFLSKINGGVENPYYPDPLANFIRVEAIQLTDDPNQSLPIDVRWLRIGTRSNWPQRQAARIRLLPQDAGGNPKVRIDAFATVEGVSSAPTLDVNLPKASTVLLTISSAQVEGGVASGQEAAYPVHLYNFSRTYIEQAQTGTLKSWSSLISHTLDKQLEEIGNSVARLPNHPLNNPDTFVNGSLDITTPKRTMTLVHAVKQPLETPSFAPAGSAGYLQIVRPAGKPEAQVSGELRAHWFSTGKITCYAEWADRIDDVNKPKPDSLPPHREVAFVITAKELVRDEPLPATRLRALKDNLVLHHFLDTRAHEITYTLVATTNFREYYPGADDPNSPTNDPHYQREGKEKLKLTVASSARPLAPKIAYLIPAFVWTDTFDKATKTWHAGRTMIVRAYLERPMLLSGDHETIAVILFDPNSKVAPNQQNFVCRWGADPTRPITTPILQNEMSEVNFCAPGEPIETCMLAEGDSARAKPCKVQYSEDRQLWYADIPINTQHANAPFVSLAFVRWQPNALSVPVEARCSQVAMAQFLQVSPDRWVSVQKIKDSQYKLTVSGAFDPQHPKCLSVTLYKRWEGFGGDTGWRKIDWPSDHPINFVYNPADSGGISSWSTPLQIPRSVDTAKCRIFLSEEEFPGQDARRSFSIFINLS